MGPLGTSATEWPNVPAPCDYDDKRIWWNEDWQAKPTYSEKTCPSATLSTTKPTWPDPGANPDRRSGKPATNRLSYGAAKSRTSFNLHTSDTGNTDFKNARGNPSWNLTENNLFHTFIVHLLLPLRCAFHTFISFPPSPFKQRTDLHIYSSDDVFCNRELPRVDMRKYDTTLRSQITHIAINRHLLCSRWAFARLRLCSCL
jgi:hypothetical protein